MDWVYWQGSGSWLGDKEQSGRKNKSLIRFLISGSSEEYFSDATTETLVKVVRFVKVAQVGYNMIIKVEKPWTTRVAKNMDETST